MERLRGLLGIPCSILLPLLALTVWVGVVAIPVTLKMMEFRNLTGGTRNATVSVGTYRGTISPGNFLPFAVNEAVITHSHVIAALNMPGTMVEMPISVATTWPEEWYPKRLELWTWRAVSEPIYCLPFWWMVGCGIDGLLRRRRLRWPVMLFGTMMFGMFGLLLAGLAAGETAGSGWMFAGLGMWVVLFATLPLVWVRQRRGV
jgi:hypothetical protein